MNNKLWDELIELEEQAESILIGPSTATNNDEAPIQRHAFARGKKRNEQLAYLRKKAVSYMGSRHEKRLPGVLKLTDFPVSTEPFWLDKFVTSKSMTAVLLAHKLRPVDIHAVIRIDPPKQPLHETIDATMKKKSRKKKRLVTLKRKHSR